jgi:hypothetical protein
MIGYVRADELASIRDIILAAVIRLCAGGAFSLQATCHRLPSTRSTGEAVERSQQHQHCHKTDDDFDASLHALFEPIILLGVQELHREAA